MAFVYIAHTPLTGRLLLTSPPSQARAVPRFCQDLDEIFFYFVILLLFCLSVYSSEPAMSKKKEKIFILCKRTRVAHRDSGGSDRCALSDSCRLYVVMKYFFFLFDAFLGVIFPVISAPPANFQLNFLILHRTANRGTGHGSIASP